MSNEYNEPSTGRKIAGLIAGAFAAYLVFSVLSGGSTDSTTFEQRTTNVTNPDGSNTVTITNSDGRETSCTYHPNGGSNCTGTRK